MSFAVIVSVPGTEANRAPEKRHALGTREPRTDRDEYRIESVDST